MRSSYSFNLVLTFIFTSEHFQALGLGFELGLVQPRGGFGGGRFCGENFYKIEPRIITHLQDAGHSEGGSTETRILGCGGEKEEIRQGKEVWIRQKGLYAGD